MSKDSIVDRIRKELVEQGDPDFRISSQRFFKDQVKCCGVKSVIVGKIAKGFDQEVVAQDKKEVFDYVMHNAYRMPRTALRYAIEKMPKNLKEMARAK